MAEKKGVFTVSLDTELAWGTFDVFPVEQFEQAYRQTPVVIERLCDLFDEYRISTTWALVSHLLVDCTGSEGHTGRTSPDFDWVDDWFDEMPCSNGLDCELWHAPELLDTLQSCETTQEIGLHGATHMPLGTEGCSKQNAEEEVSSAVETLQQFGVEPKSFVFPRNEIGHLDVLAEHGIQTYRGVDARWYERTRVPDSIRSPFRFLDEVGRRTPPVVEPTLHDGIVEIPGSQVFRPTHGGWQYTLPGSSVSRAKKGLRQAASTGGIYHLWLHPFSLGYEPEKDLRRFEDVLQAARELVDQDELVVCSMAEVGQIAREKRWN